jgi:hypothetical protein
VYTSWELVVKRHFRLTIQPEEESVKRALLFLTLAFSVAVMPIYAGVILGGTDHGNLDTALTALGDSYTDVGNDMIDPSSYGAGDVLILGMDGGGSIYDYASFLNSGGHLIVTGGSNDGGYRTWAADYFNLTDTGSGWQTDGAWHTTVVDTATEYLPANYTFGDAYVTYHMLAFLPTANTVLLGTNDEPYSILALRTYANGGSFEYLAIDPSPARYGTAGDLTNFTEPFLRGALQEAGASTIPEPATGGLIGIGILLLAAFRRR